MTISEFTPLLTRHIKESTPEQIVDFALNICRRLLPEYIHFSNRNNWGDPGILKESIELCTKNKAFQNIEINRFKELHKAMELVIPDTDDFGDFDGSYALNASCAVLELLEFFLHNDKIHALNISTYMTDTIDFKISESEPDLTNEQLNHHVKIVKELNYQLELIKNNVA